MTRIGPIVGATTPLKIQDVLIPGDLAIWGANLAAEAIVDALEAKPDTAWPDLQRAAQMRVTRSRNIGTAVHDEIAAVLRQEQRPPASPDVAPYLWSWTRFLADERPEFIHVERRIVNPKAMYAGTFDFIARIRGRLALGDIKSGRFKESSRLQLAAYSMGSMADEEALTIDQYHRYWFDDTAELTPVPRVKDYYILLLTPTEYDLKKVDVTRKDRAHFLKLVKTYRALREWEAQ